MSIRTKLLVFLPLLVLLANAITFFLFESSKVVQTSYQTLMDRILLVQQTTEASESQLQTLYNYLIDPTEAAKTKTVNASRDLGLLRDELRVRGLTAGHAESTPAFVSYSNLVSTLVDHASAAVAAKPGEQQQAFARYDQAEETTGFIREAGAELVDQELTAYAPVYAQVQAENERMNRLGMAVFLVNTALSIAVAIWISRSITRPVARLVDWAGRIAKGNFSTMPAQEKSHADELGALSDAFRRMLADLKHLIEKDKESLEKDRLVKELELAALQNQINPHFLFNTLNVLSKLALMEGAEQTSDLIVSMSSMLRYNLQRLDQPVPLSDELKHVESYIRIQKARFRDRIQFETSADPDVLHMELPALTIQPLIENAFVHGIEGIERGGTIRLNVQPAEDGGAVVTISDNGRGMPAEVREAVIRLEEGQLAGRRSAAGGTGLGMRNVFKRLALFYGRTDLVTVWSEPDAGTSITIHIPNRKEES
ncbi:sensor histidine kinase YesM [Paenibacillus phyllosphaerae]|uniref:histidine kinase n=1 Tax=Paenibacillus phyllosphaerae TaxID=274593 RepID=A0A7W5ATS4_9BACL|nr:sensor histidine kinase [Paenibacillus phyllosphaerae]MBB3108635.1 sensor histidine kinase YesM [Paenibacillus phyllosphaerae]